MLTDYLYGWLTEGEVSTIAAQHEGRGQKIYGFFFTAGAQRLRKFPRLVLNGKLDGDIKLVYGRRSTVNYGKSGCDTEVQFSASQTTCRSLRHLRLVLRTFSFT